MARSFEALVDDANRAPVDGWDFSWLDGRAIEERPPWGYQRLLGEHMAQARRALDVQTGGGEVLAGARARAPVTVATEAWPPNAIRANRTLRPLGVSVVAHSDQPPLPFRDATFDLVVSRHPVTTWWGEIARVLEPGGHYFSQEVGPASAFELVEFFMGAQPAEIRNRRHPDHACAAAEQAGLDVIDLRTSTLRMEFFDVGAVIYFLRKVIWIVPGFTVEAYRDELRYIHERIERDGPFIAHSTRFLIDARRSR